MNQRPPRFTGEYHGHCQECDAHSSFSFGFSEDHEPRAITWEGPECVSIPIGIGLYLGLYVLAAQRWPRATTITEKPD
ncbi:MAG: hypothetical protein IIB33_00890 [Chloroflexi bacterium]|nr:hypothetical protein [Chloroflexota bacterium]